MAKKRFKNSVIALLTTFAIVISMVWIGSSNVSEAQTGILNPSSANVDMEWQGNVWATVGMIGGDFAIHNSSLWHFYSHTHNDNHSVTGVYGFEVSVAPFFGADSGEMQPRVKIGTDSERGVSIPYNATGSDLTFRRHGPTNLIDEENAGLSIRAGSNSIGFYITSIYVLDQAGNRTTEGPLYAYNPVDNSGPGKAIASSLTTNVINSASQRINGFDYESWRDNRGLGQSKMDIYEDGTFAGTYSQSYNTLFRVGRRFGNSTTVSSIGNISFNYDVTDYTSTNTSYLTVYGWSFEGTTQNPTNLIEYYIMDNWLTWSPVDANGNPRSGYTRLSSFETDGAIYDVIVGTRVNQPSIFGDRTFLQIFSIRRGSARRNSGTINVSAHLNEWVRVVNGISSGNQSITFRNSANLYEAMLCIEGFGGDNLSAGSGTVNKLCITYGNNSICTDNGCAHCGSEPIITTTTSAATTTTTATTLATTTATSATTSPGTSTSATSTTNNPHQNAVSFDPNGGLMNFTSAEIRANGRLSVNLPTPTREGNSFRGWFTDTGISVASDTAIYKNPLTLTARWAPSGAIIEIVRPTITFDSNGGTELAHNSRLTENNLTIGELPTPTREGYTLEGWFTSPTGGVSVTTRSIVDKDATIYAHWIPVDGTTATSATTSGPTDTSGTGTTSTGTSTSGTGTASTVSTTSATTTSGGTTTTVSGTSPGSATTTTSATGTSATSGTTTSATSATTSPGNTTVVTSSSFGNETDTTSTSTSGTVAKPTIGDVDGNGTIAIADALEILKFLAGMNSMLSDPVAYDNARITGGEKPAIADVLEILKYLAKMNSMLDVHHPRN
ncbi:MAG: glycoside hydrolase family 11 protein [Oscillospiraceae bacterium]|nr:glycoside hydrolase family 11 protein [Oscillospiraceae bacterium]